MSRTGDNVVQGGIYRAICNTHGRQQIVLQQDGKFPQCEEGEEEAHEVNWELIEKDCFLVATN